MKSGTIIEKLIKNAEEIGYSNPRAILEKFTEWKIDPRCGKCGAPLQIVDMADCDTIYLGCPNQDKSHTHSEFPVRSG